MTLVKNHPIPPQVSLSSFRVRSQRSSCAVRRQCVCRGCCVASLFSPPTVSPGVPPASPQSEVAWSLGSPSSVTPPSRLLRGTTRTCDHLSPQIVPPGVMRRLWFSSSPWKPCNALLLLILSQTRDSITTQLPFSCDKTRKQLTEYRKGLQE